MCQWNNLYMNLLGDEIKRRLKGRGLTQTWLAKQVNLSPAQITQIIKGQRGTSINKLFDIGRVLGIQRDEIARLYENKLPENKSNVRKTIEAGLDQIERMDAERLHQVADFVQLVANSIRGAGNAAPSKRNKTSNT